LSVAHTPKNNLKKNLSNQSSPHRICGRISGTKDSNQWLLIRGKRKILQRLCMMTRWEKLSMKRWLNWTKDAKLTRRSSKWWSWPKNRNKWELTQKAHCAQKNFLNKCRPANLTRK